MFLINFANIISGKIKNANAYVRRIDGTYESAGVSALGNSSGTNSIDLTAGNTTGLWIAFGSGTTEVNKDDYTLAEQLTDYTVISNTITLRYDVFDSDIMIVNRTIKNTGSSDMIVKEMALVYTYNSASGKSAILSREVLKNPVTIKPDEIYSFTITARN